MAGAALPGLAQELLSSNGGDGLPKRTNSGPAGQTVIRQDTDREPSTVQRRLQLRLIDSGKGPVARSDVAYAALLMNDHDLGIRTLGQSLIDSRTSADLVAVLGPGVTKAAEVRMRAQGWRIRRIAVDGVAGGEVCDMDSASGSVLAHASVWALTEYKRVVFLADNMLVVENIDDLFQCPGICAAMQQGEVMSTSLIVLEPDVEMHRQMSQTVGKIYSFSNDFQGFLNSYLAGFETCALFDLENPSLQDPSTDPSRGPDAPLLDHSCHRLPTRYNGDLGLVMLNGGLGMVRTKNSMPEEWWRQRRARVVRYEFAGLRPWMWFASPFLPFVSTWESAHLRAKPGDAMPSMLWAMFVWVSFVGAVMMARALLTPMVLSGSSYDFSRGDSLTKGPVGWRAWMPRSSACTTSRRSGLFASSYNPRGLVWSVVHLTVGYSSLVAAVAVGFARVPPASTVKVSWIIFITWTTTIFGMLWSLYLWFVSRQLQVPSRPFAIGNSLLDLPANGTPNPLSPTRGASADPFKPKVVAEKGGGSAGSAVKVVPPCPWRESVRSLALFAAVLAFLPAWKPLSGAGSLPTLLGPAALALISMVVGLTVQMVRLPVLWCDRLKHLSSLEREALQPCGKCGRRIE
eukprot:g7280.t1